jgi:hypothetical protein
MTAFASSPRNLPHTHSLGACWMIYGIFRLATAVWMAVFSGTATVMFGALLTRVPEPFSLMADFHLLYLVVLVWAAVSGLVGLLAGVALLTGLRAHWCVWRRIFASATPLWVRRWAYTR